MNISGYWSDKLLQEMNSTEVTGKARDALLNAQNLIDNKVAYDAEDFLALEDPEMAQVVIQTASQEVNRALAEMRGSEGSAQYTQQYIVKAQQLFAEAERELQFAINQGAQSDAARSNGTRR